MKDATTLSLWWWHGKYTQQLLQGYNETLCEVQCKYGAHGNLITNLESLKCSTTSIHMPFLSK